MKRITEIINVCIYKMAYYLNYPLVKPDTLQISLTHRCNLHCRMCSVNKYLTTKEEEISLEEVCKVIVVASKQFGIKKLILTGGEPLLLGDMITEISVFAKNKDMSVILTSNGFYLKEYARTLANSSISHFHISIDGLRNTHNYIRGNPLSFDRAKEGIEILNDLRKRYNFQYSIGVGTVILKNNINELYDLFMYADGLGVDIFDLLPYLPDNTDFSNTDYTVLWPDKNDVEQFLKIYNNIIATKTKHIRINTFLDVDLTAKYYRREMHKNDWQCMAGYKNIFITLSDPKRRGRFEPCIFMCKKHIPLRDYDYNLKKIWYSSQAFAARHDIRHCNACCYQPCFSLPSILKLMKLRK